MIGNGVVIDPKVLTDEIDGLRAKGIDLSGLRISANAHLIMPYHMLLDHAGEARLGKLQIGTTRRGIGPCYADKAARLGIRVQDLLDEKILKKKIVAALEPKRLLLRPYAKAPELDLQSMTEEYLTYGHRLEQYIADTAQLIWDVLDAGGNVIFEGAQGTLLDIDHGTYPFVTSSNPVAASACTGAGVGPKDIDEIWGVAKAYATRVGAGPFPTELDDELGDELREAGGEYGTTTGRARRVGWLDLVALRYAARINGLDAAGDHQARRADRPRRAAGLHALPRHRGGDVRHTSPTTSRSCTTRRASTRSCPAGTRTSRDVPRASDDLPADRARLPRSTSRTFVGVPIALVGVGPGRDQVIWTEAGARASLAARRAQRRKPHSALKAAPAGPASTRTTRSPASPSERGLVPLRIESTKCSHSIRSGSLLAIRGERMSPERVMYSP